MTIGFREWKTLDDKVCFEYWIKYDTLRAAYQKLLDDHYNDMINPYTGNPISRPRVQSAALRYVLDHQEETRPIISEAWEAHGRILTDEIWKSLLVAWCKFVWRPSTAARNIHLMGLDGVKSAIITSKGIFNASVR